MYSHIPQSMLYYMQSNIKEYASLRNIPQNKKANLLQKDKSFSRRMVSSVQNRLVYPKNITL